MYLLITSYCIFLCGCRAVFLQRRSRELLDNDELQVDFFITHLQTLSYWSLFINLLLYTPMYVGRICGVFWTSIRQWYRVVKSKWSTTRTSLKPDRRLGLRPSKYAILLIVHIILPDNQANFEIEMFNNVYLQGIFHGKDVCQAAGEWPVWQNINNAFLQLRHAQGLAPSDANRPLVVWCWRTGLPSRDG